MNRLFIGCVAVAICVPARLSTATPDVEHLYPSGGVADATHQVLVVGAVDPWPPRVWTSSENIAVEPAAKNGELAITVAKETPAGVYWIRLYNDEGASAPRPFVVGRGPETRENEPNNRLSAAQKIEPRCVINGRLASTGDHDTFRFELDAGETVVAALDAVRSLGSSMDGVLQLLSAKGIVLAQNDDDVGSDPFLIFTAPRSGEYAVRLFAFPIPPNQSIEFAGRPSYVYRLTLTTQAFVDHVFPSCLQRGATGDLKVAGWNLPPDLHSLRLHAETRQTSVLVRHPRLANAVPVTLVDHAVVLETPEQPLPLSPPVSAAGRLLESGDVDRYSFDASKDGGALELTVIARAHGSLLDAVLRIIDTAGNELASNDDANGVDARLRFTPPQDGTYVVEVRDAFGHGGFRYTYNLQVGRPAKRCSVTLAADRFALKAGEPLQIPVKVARQNGYDRPMEIKATGLPASVTQTVVVSTAGTDTAGEVQLTLFTAAPGPVSTPFHVVAREIAPAGRRLTATFGAAGKQRLSTAWLTVPAAAADSE